MKLAVFHVYLLMFACLPTFLNTMIDTSPGSLKIFFIVNFKSDFWFLSPGKVYNLNRKVAKAKLLLIFLPLSIDLSLD